MLNNNSNLKYLAKRVDQMEERMSGLEDMVEELSYSEKGGRGWIEKNLRNTTLKNSGTL